MCAVSVRGLGVCRGCEEVVGWNTAGLPVPSGLSFTASNLRESSINEHYITRTQTQRCSALISYYMLCSSVISRAPGLKLVVETLMSSLKPIGNIVVICCAFFIIFGILGVQVRRGRMTAQICLTQTDWSMHHGIIAETLCSFHIICQNTHESLSWLQCKFNGLLH